MLQKPSSRKAKRAPLLRERNVEARRQRILTAARSLLREGGLRGLSMRKLAREAQLSVNTLYNLWGTREEILEALFLDAKDRIDELIPAATLPEDPVDHCRALIRDTVREVVADERVYRAMILARIEGAIAGYHYSAEVMAHVVRRLAAAIKVARKTGIVDSTLKPKQVALQIHQGFDVAALEWAFGGLDDAQFEARALYGLNLALLAIVHADYRPEIEATLRTLERKLRNSAEVPQ